MAISDQIHVLNSGINSIEELRLSLISITGALISKCTHSIYSNSKIIFDKNGLGMGSILNLSYYE